jgi:hypothetical protein
MKQPCFARGGLGRGKTIFDTLTYSAIDYTVEIHD